jgi:hypothetical protein
MPRNYDELNSVIAELIRKTKEEPSDADFALLKCVTLRDVASFFESVANEKSDKARYDKMLLWLHNREQEKVNAVKRAEEAKRKAEEERLAKIKAEEDAKKKAEEERLAKIKAEEEAKAQAELARLAKIKADEEAKLKAEQERKEQAERAAAQAQAAAEAEKVAKEAHRQEMLKTNIGQCANCDKWIDKKAKYLECDDMVLHPECLEPWQEKNCPKCAQCGKLCTDDYITLTRGEIKATLHEECSAAYKAAHPA